LKDEKSCPLFIGRYIRGVKNDVSPAWLQQRLKSAGQKPISALVDITNYLTLGLNRPRHVFDADKLKGNIHVRLSKKGETFAALNDQ
jgi:phenylalanyl-tRNA synthetase beta chain